MRKPEYSAEKNGILLTILFIIGFMFCIIGGFFTKCNINIFDVIFYIFGGGISFWTSIIIVGGLTTDSINFNWMWEKGEKNEKT
jgi:hypothetical protein